MTEQHKLDDIVIGIRHRRDLGDIDVLARSISDVGLLHPIVIRSDGVLVAGERRLSACKQLGWKEVPVTVIDLDEIARGEFAENAIRKDFLPSEIDAIRRALEPIEKAAAKERETLGKISLGSDTGRVRDKIGSFAGVSGRTVEKIAKVVKAAEADPEKFGHLTAEMDERGVDGAYKKLRVAQRREAIEIASIDPALPLGRRFPVLYADPPWRYENPPMGDTGRSIENHYQTMTLEEIKALPVADIAADDSILFLWATAPKLAECMEVISAWGFEYRTEMVWVKDKIGMGYYVRNQHESLLICRRGTIPPPTAGEQPSSVLFAPRTEHSKKPTEFAELIERLYPELGKVELFCRGKPREGWVGWGNQAKAA